MLEVVAFGPVLLGCTIAAGRQRPKYMVAVQGCAIGANGD
jgi:hypothetical protein